MHCTALLSIFKLFPHAALIQSLYHRAICLILGLINGFIGRSWINGFCNFDGFFYSLAVVLIYTHCHTGSDRCPVSTDLLVFDHFNRKLEYICKDLYPNIGICRAAGEI